MVKYLRVETTRNWTLTTRICGRVEDCCVILRANTIGKQNMDGSGSFSACETMLDGISGGRANASDELPQASSACWKSVRGA